MRATFSSKVLLTAIALTVLGQAEAGKPGGGGGTTPPPAYAPTVVNVACNGTGAVLQTALNALNPVANVYDVAVTGVCPEPVSLANFASITIRSANANSPATLNSITVSNGNNYVVIRDLVINVTDSSVEPFGMGIYKPSDGRLDVQDVTFNCSNKFYSDCFSTVQMIGSGDLRLYGGTVNGNWLGVAASRNGTVLVASSVKSPNLCLQQPTYTASFGSVIRILESGTGCVTGAVYSNDGATVTYEGSNSSILSSVVVRNGTVIGQSTDAANLSLSWFNSFSCSGVGSLITDRNPPNGRNYCAP